MDDVRHEWAEHVGEGGQDADDLASLLGLEFADAIVGFDDGFGLDVDRLAGGRFVVHDTADSSLEGGGYGDDESAVAHGGRRVTIHPAFSLRRAEDGLQVAGDAARDGRHVAADTGQLSRGAILRAAVAVEDGVDVAHELWEDGHSAGHCGQHGILRLGVVALVHGPKEARDVDDGLQRAFEVEQLQLVGEGAFGPYAAERRAYVYKIICRESTLPLQNADKLACLFQLFGYDRRIGREANRFYLLATQRTEALRGDQFADLVEAEFMFKVFRINHVVQFSSIVFSERSSGRMMYSNFSVPRRRCRMQTLAPVPSGLT